MDELARRVGLDDLAVDDNLRRAPRPHRLGGAGAVGRGSWVLRPAALGMMRATP